MLAAEEETGRRLFAVYVRGPDMRGAINFYPDEAAAEADVGPGMPPGILTHGDTYVEYIGESLFFAAADVPLIGVPTDSLVQLQADDGEVFIALTPAESNALLSVAAGLPGAVVSEQVSAVLPEVVEIDPPDGLTGTQSCAVWFPDGRLALFPDGAGGRGREFEVKESRGEFGDEVATDLAVVRLLDEGWAPLVVDTHTWREVGDAWVINVQQRIADAEELFLSRYTAYDRTLVVTRSGSDTGLDEEHLQLLSDDLECDFELLNDHLERAGWAIDDSTTAASDLSVHPELSESPGWFPAESEEGIEWVAALRRVTPA